MTRTLSVFVDSFDTKNIIDMIKSLQQTSMQSGFDLVIRFEQETALRMMQDKECLNALQEILAADATMKLGDSVLFTIEDMCNAITYGFTYYRDTMHDNKDVSLGNKLQFLGYYSKLSDKARAQDTQSRIDKK